MRWNLWGSKVSEASMLDEESGGIGGQESLMGMTWSPRLETNFFLGFSRLVAFLHSWRGPHVKLRTWHCAQCQCCMRLLFSPKLSMGRGRQSWARQAAQGVHTDLCKGQAWYWGLPVAAVMSTTCSLSSLHHAWDLCTGNSHGPPPRHISCQKDFLWISFRGMAAPSPLRLGMIWFGALQVAHEGSWAWKRNILLYHISLSPVWVFGCHGSSKLWLFPIAKRLESGMRWRAQRAKNAAEDWQESGAGERCWWAHGWHWLSPLGLGKYFANCCCLWWFEYWSAPTSESEQGQCPGWHQALGSCMLCQVRVKPGTALRSEILSISILLAPTPSQEFVAGVGIFWTKQSEVNGVFRKPRALHSYGHILSEVNLIQGVYIQNILKMSSSWTYLPILHFESSGEELHKMVFAFQPEMALFQLQVSNPADKSLGSPGRDGTRL